MNKQTIVTKIYLLINMLGFGVLLMACKRLFFIRVLKDDDLIFYTQNQAFKLKVLMPMECYKLSNTRQ